MAKKSMYGVDEKVIDNLKNMDWYVDVEFGNEKVYEKAKSLGFNKEEWENKNKMKVIIGKEL